MTARAREPHAFAVGDPARVFQRERRIADRVVVADRGFIVGVTSLVVRFRGITGQVWTYERKGNRWVERHHDQFELKP